MKTLYIAAGIAALSLSFNSYAADCNRNAQVHQQRLANIQMALANGRVITPDDEQFAFCMLPEKEDREAIDQKLQQNKVAQARFQADMQQAQRAAEQRDAATRASSLKYHLNEEMQFCESNARTANRPENLRPLFTEACRDAWRAEPESSCNGYSMPCKGQCIDLNSHNGYQYAVCKPDGSVQWLPLETQQAQQSQPQPQTQPQNRNNLPPGLPQAAANAATNFLSNANHKAMCIAWDRQTGKSGWGTNVGNPTLQGAIHDAMQACARSRQQYQVQSSCAVLISDNNVVLAR